MNTIAGQVSMFRAGDSAVREPPVFGPSLSEWAGVDDDTYLPRSVLGRYLSYCYQRFRRHAPDTIVIREHRAVAQTLRPLTDRSWAIDLSDGSIIAADFVFLAIGHGTNRPTPEDNWLDQFVADHRRANPRLRYIRRCYPLEQLDTIAPGARVAVRGMGLSAIDTIASLTVGRGGRFVPQSDGGMVYRPSGAEPKIYVYSRTCRVFWARGVNQKSPAERYRASFMTLKAVRAMRLANDQLDFEKHLLPLLLTDMRVAAGSVGLMPNLRDIEPILRPPDWNQCGTLGEYQSAIVDFLVTDGRRAAEGNRTNPIKAATDALRDMRDELRSAVEHGGLTPESHERFCRVYSPTLNNVAAGPPVSRSREWHALFDSGILHLGAGPGARVHPDSHSTAFAIQSAHRSPATHCDVVIGANVDPFLPDRDTSPLSRSLLAAGHARPFENGWFRPGGFDIDTGGRLIDARGSITPNICALGHITEGAHYFTNMLPAPGVDSRVTADAAAAVGTMFDYLPMAGSYREDLISRQGATP